MNRDENENMQWFVLRDLKRPNAKLPAYEDLPRRGFKVFTPKKIQLVQRNGRRIKESVPYIRDLLFVHAKKEELDTLIRETSTLQYRYVKGEAYCSPMIVRGPEMERFITAVSTFKNPQFFRPEEIRQSMIGAKIRIISEGPMHNMEGNLLKIAGSGKKRLFVSIPDLLATAVEITSADYVEVIGC